MTFKEAASKLDLSERTLIKYYDRGWLQKYMTDPSQKRLTDGDIMEIDAVKNPPLNSISMAELKRRYCINDQTLRSLFQNLHIEPVLKHRAHYISPKSDYYDRNVLPQLENALLQKRRAENRHIDFELIPNTKRLYNSQTDYLKGQMYQVLPITMDSTNTYRWIKAGLLGDNYSIDPTGRLYFTPEQCQYLKQHYHHLPENTYGTTEQLANALGIQKSNLICFRNWYHLTTFRVFGYKDVFYTNETAEKLIDWYRHPKHRPYPMNWYQIKD